jgi:protochlorophyllide reductase
MLSIPLFSLGTILRLAAPVQLPERDMSGQIVLVTGANTGIGRGTAAALYAHGATVVMACRSIERGEAAKAEIENALVRGDTGGALIEP